MAKGNSLSGLLGRLAAGREVKTFDNQRNAEQAGHIYRDVAMAMSHA
jgi:hypothetical protein